MTKLFQFIHTRTDDVFYCFANDEKTALKIITKELFNGKKKVFTVKDVTSEKIQEDGVKFLSDANFVGIPQQKIFMLNGCMGAMHQHYVVEKRTPTFWYSEAIPESEKRWK